MPGENELEGKIFDSTADERVGNNLSEEQRLEVIKGLKGDDVALSFRKLSDAEKQGMFAIKVKAQELIDIIREQMAAGADPAEATLGIRAAQQASMWAVGSIVKNSGKPDNS